MGGIRTKGKSEFAQQGLTHTKLERHDAAEPTRRTVQASTLLSGPEMQVPQHVHVQLLIAQQSLMQAGLDPDEMHRDLLEAQRPSLDSQILAIRRKNCQPL